MCAYVCVCARMCTYACRFMCLCAYVCMWICVIVWRPDLYNEYLSQSLSTEVFETGSLTESAGIKSAGLAGHELRRCCCSHTCLCYGYRLMSQKPVFDMCARGAKRQFSCIFSKRFTYGSIHILHLLLSDLTWKFLVFVE